MGKIRRSANYVILLPASADGEEKMAIPVKQAVRAASDELRELYDSVTLADILLEEVELAEDGKFWLITLGFSRPVSHTENPLAQYGKEYKREFKQFKVDALTGEVQSMKIRAV